MRGAVHGPVRGDRAPRPRQAPAGDLPAEDRACARPRLRREDVDLDLLQVEEGRPRRPVPGPWSAPSVSAGSANCASTAAMNRPSLTWARLGIAASSVTLAAAVGDEGEGDVGENHVGRARSGPGRCPAATPAIAGRVPLPGCPGGRPAPPQSAGPGRGGTLGTRDVRRPGTWTGAGAGAPADLASAEDRCRRSRARVTLT